jgi:hypothetical protein
MAMDPIFSMSGSGSSSHEGPVLSASVTQPRARAGAVNSNTHPPASAPSPQPSVPNPNAGSIRSLSMAPSNSAAVSALTVAVASAVGAEQARPALHPLAPSGHGGGVAPLAEGGPNDPTIHFSGDNVVGGAGEVILSAPAGKTLQTVTWQISGAEQSQSFVNSKGSATDLPNPDGPLPEAGGSAQLDFFWNLQTGDHTISASVVYANNGGAGTSNTVTVTVVAPSVVKHQVTYTPLAWGTIPNRNPAATGFYEVTLILPVYNRELTAKAEVRSQSVTIQIVKRPES